MFAIRVWRVVRMPIPVGYSLAALIDSTEPHLVRVLLSCASVSRVTSNRPFAALYLAFKYT